MHWARWLLGAAVVLHLLMMASLFFGYLDPFFSDSNVHPQGLDTFAIYEAGRSAIENRSVYYWDPLDTSATPYHTPYRYLPAFAYVFAAPLNAVSAWWVYWGWVAFYELVLLVNAYATWRVAGKGTWALVAAAMWFVFTPFYPEQYLGQFNFLMATALFWIAIAVIRAREGIGGSVWMASLVTKSITGLLLPLFLRLGWWRSVGAGVAVLALNMVYFVARPRDLGYFIRFNFGEVHTGLSFLQFEPREGEAFFFVDWEIRAWAYGPGDQGAVAFIRNSLMTLDPTSTGVPLALPILLAIGVGGYSLLATFLTPRTDPLVLFAIWVSAFFLTYATWEPHYVMYLPVVVLLVALRPSIRPWALMAFALVALPTPYWLLDNVWNTGPVPGEGVFISNQEVWPAWGVVLHHAVKPVPVFLLWTYLVTTQLRGGIDFRWPSVLRVRSKRV